jgi:hypothetical protein
VVLCGVKPLRYLVSKQQVKQIAGGYQAAAARPRRAPAHLPPADLRHQQQHSAHKGAERRVGLQKVCGRREAAAAGTMRGVVERGEEVFLVNSDCAHNPKAAGSVQRE